MRNNKVYIEKRRVGESPLAFTGSSIHALSQIVAAAFDALGTIHSMCRGSRVVVKPNLVRPGPHYGPAVNTDPRVVAAVCSVISDAGASDVIVGDDPGWGLSSIDAYAAWGHEDLIKSWGGRMVPFDSHPRLAVEVPSNRLLTTVSIPGVFRDADVFVNLPKMKTHMLTHVSLGIKNLHGMIPDDQRLLFHRGDVEIKLIDILCARLPELTVIDGIWALEGQAPLYGETVTDMDTLVLGDNAVAVDAVAASIMAFDPQELGVLREAAYRGLGPLSLDGIDLQGVPISDVYRPFRRAVLSSVGVYSSVEVIEGAADPGVLNALRHALDRLSLEGVLSGIDPLTVLVGRFTKDRLPRVATKEVWLFGDCALDVRDLMASRHRVFEVSGDPPHIFDLYKAFRSAHGL